MKEQYYKEMIRQTKWLKRPAMKSDGQDYWRLGMTLIYKEVGMTKNIQVF